MIYQKNKYLYDISNSSTYLREFYNEIVTAETNEEILTDNASNVCMKKIDNCIVYVDYNECGQCEEGYYLSNK